MVIVFSRKTNNAPYTIKVTARGNLCENGNVTTIIRVGPSVNMSARTHGIVFASIFKTPLRSRLARSRSDNVCVWLIETKNRVRFRYSSEDRTTFQAPIGSRPFCYCPVPWLNSRQGYRSTSKLGGKI